MVAVLSGMVAEVAGGGIVVLVIVVRDGGGDGAIGGLAAAVPSGNQEAHVFDSPLRRIGSSIVFFFLFLFFSFFFPPSRPQCTAARCSCDFIRPHNPSSAGPHRAVHAPFIIMIIIYLCKWMKSLEQHLPDKSSLFVGMNI